MPTLLGDYSNALHYSDKAFSLLNLIPEWDENSYEKLSMILLLGELRFIIWEGMRRPWRI